MAELSTIMADDAPVCIELAAGDTFRLALADGEHWYGHGFNHQQPYPLESGEISADVFAVNNIQSPVWMSSVGFVLLVETVERLGVRLNVGGNRLFELTALDAPVRIRIFRGQNLPEAHQQYLQYIGWPPPIPTSAQLGESLFCTWTEYPRCVTQVRLLQFARDIRAHGYPCTTLILDDRWESCFGELAFADDFPDPVALVQQLRAWGFELWLWVTPFVNKEANNFSALAEAGALVPHIDGQGPALLRWWGGTAGLVDVTAPAGQEWLRSRLHYLRDVIGVTGFKIDGGDFKYQPAPDIAAWYCPPGPSGYSDALLALFEEIAPLHCETRTAWLSQRRGILWRQGGKDSHWGIDNGLAAMITLAQQLALLGYDLLIPDMIPGRVQTMVADMPLPTDELFVRWTEATAFLPMMQFSYAPWHYAAPTQVAAAGYAQLHALLGDYLHEQSQQRTAPLVRPLWYADPNDAALYTIPDAFLLGSDILAAPVVTEGAISRDVYLPRGQWRDAWTGVEYAGGLLVNHPAPCPGIPIFVRAEQTELYELLHSALCRINRASVLPGVTTTTYSAGLDRDLTVTG